MYKAIHPEVLPDVLKEFKRLDLKHPHVAKDIKMQFAQEYVNALCLSDSVLLLRTLWGTH